MTAIINPTCGPEFLVTVVHAYDARSALKARGYQFSRDCAVGDDYLAPSSRLARPGGLYDPIVSGWERHLPPSVVIAEIEWLESLGSTIGGEIGAKLFAFRAAELEAQHRESRDADLVAAACAVQWSPWQQALASEILKAST